MKWIIVLVFLLIAPMAFAQTPEVGMTPADVGIRFSGEVDWINGGDTTQAIFSIDSISYSSEPMSPEVSHTTKLNEPETWEVAMWRLPSEPFKKAVFVITIYQATNRVFELRVRGRFLNDDTSGPWSLPTEDKVIGKPEKPVHLR